MDTALPDGAQWQKLLPLQAVPVGAPVYPPPTPSLGVSEHSEGEAIKGNAAPSTTSVPSTANPEDLDRTEKKAKVRGKCDYAESMQRNLITNKQPSFLFRVALDIPIYR